MTEFKKQLISLTVRGVDLQVAALHREGTGEPILFLHGFGSTKEDYADITRHAAFADQPFVAYDAPGCGETQCSDLDALSIGFLRDTALAVLAHFGIDQFHLLGHSMGGLTGLLLAHEHPERVFSFVDIEGNIAPEDCFLSRQIVEFPEADPERFFAYFIERTRQAPNYASALYAASLNWKVRAQAVKPIFASMVELSDHADLMTKFLGLPCPTLFMYGEQNASLSYLDHIGAHGVVRCEVPFCGHFPMYSNPIFMWRAVAQFYASAPVRSRAVSFKPSLRRIHAPGRSPEETDDSRAVYPASLL